MDNRATPSTFHVSPTTNSHTPNILPSHGFAHTYSVPALRPSNPTKSPQHSHRREKSLGMLVDLYPTTSGSTSSFVSVLKALQTAFLLHFPIPNVVCSSTSLGRLHPAPLINKQLTTKTIFPPDLPTPYILTSHTYEPRATTKT